MKNNRLQTDRVLSYFQAEWKVLLIVMISGLIYNLGLLAGPWFEGQMTGCLALLCMIFPPVSYTIAEKMKRVVQKTGAAYKV